MRCFLTFLVAGASVFGPGLLAGTLAIFRSPVGEIDVELFDTDKPVTVTNFMQYVTSGAYTNMFIHRWETNFVIQGGGYYTVNRHATNVGLALVPTSGTITNEYSVGRTFSNTYGTIAMARVGGQTNSATSQWFFNLTNNSFLDSMDGGFTVFGRTVRGTNVLNRFLGEAYSTNIGRINIGGALNHLPVLATNPTTYEDLVYMDISILKATISRGANGARVISWQSVSNAVNKIEFATTTPANWATLVSTNGTGQTLEFTDTAADLNRTYRVSVDF
jgi:cyclophilin family peptidyl-prolyl cis-trans isomerase